MRRRPPQGATWPVLISQPCALSSLPRGHPECRSRRYLGSICLHFTPTCLSSSTSQPPPCSSPTLSPSPQTNHHGRMAKKAFHLESPSHADPKQHEREGFGQKLWLDDHEEKPMLAEPPQHPVEPEQGVHFSSSSGGGVQEEPGCSEMVGGVTRVCRLEEESKWLARCESFDYNEVCAFETLTRGIDVHCIPCAPPSLRQYVHCKMHMPDHRYTRSTRFWGGYMQRAFLRPLSRKGSQKGHGS